MVDLKATTGKIDDSGKIIQCPKAWKSSETSVLLRLERIKVSLRFPPPKMKTFGDRGTKRPVRWSR